jgi:hypothetical protein
MHSWGRWHPWRQMMHLRLVLAINQTCRIFRVVFPVRDRWNNAVLARRSVAQRRVIRTRYSPTLHGSLYLRTALMIDWIHRKSEKTRNEGVMRRSRQIGTRRCSTASHCLSIPTHSAHTYTYISNTSVGVDGGRVSAHTGADIAVQGLNVNLPPHLSLLPTAFNTMRP